MCGIVGWVGAEASPELSDRLRHGHREQRHRGPDGDGWLEYVAATGRVTLLREVGMRDEAIVPPRSSASHVLIGHRRLAILDLSDAGRQPMSTPDRRYWLAFNGEIYNHGALRAELERRGRSFRSSTDTEVLLHAFCEWQAGVFERLVGMFAFVLLDTAAGTLVLARDHFGQKPLYYQRHDAGISFASEMRTLLTVSGRRATARPSVVFDLLAGGATDHRPETMFEGIDAVPAGHWIELDLDRPLRVIPRQYWALQPGSGQPLAFDEAAGHLRQVFLESVDLHLRSDVPVGSLLSGGVDSSSVVMAVRRIRGSAHDLHTFSYRGRHGAWDEGPWIDAVNAAARSIPHTLSLTPEAWSQNIDGLVSAQDEPFGSLAIYAQQLLFRLAADTGVKVLLDGQGGDEVLGGYRMAWTMRLATLLRRGRWFGALRFLSRLARARGPLDPRPARILRSALGVSLPLTRARPTPVWLNTPWFREREVQGLHPLLVWRPRTLQEAMVRTTLVGLPALLRWADRNSMMSSVESRLPFLTPALAEACLGLPDAYLVGPDGTNKYVFRSAMRGLVPDPVLDRYEKIGFSVPHQSWLHSIPDLHRRLEAARDMRCLDYGAVDRMRATLRRGGAMSRSGVFELWRIIGFVNWARVFDVRFP